MGVCEPHLPVTTDRFCFRANSHGDAWERLGGTALGGRVGMPAEPCGAAPGMPERRQCPEASRSQWRVAKRAGGQARH